MRKFISLLLTLTMLLPLGLQLALPASAQEALTRVPFNTDSCSGTWIDIQPQDTADGVGFRYSETKDSIALFHFYGSSVQWLGSTGPFYGKAKIAIDGVSYGTVDCYAAQETKDTVCFETDGLRADGLHTLQVIALGTRNARSQGAFVNIRGFAAAQPDTYMADARAEYEAELAEIATGNRPTSDPDSWTPVANAASVPQNGVTLTGGPAKTSYDRFLSYLKHCWNGGDEAEVFAQSVTEDQLADAAGFFGNGMSFGFGGNGSQNAALREVSIVGGDGNGEDAWTLGNSWSLTENEAKKQTLKTDSAAGVTLIHNGAADAADKAAYATKLSGEGFALSFTADFSANTDDHTLYVVLDSGDGQRLETKIINSRINNVFGPEGIFYDDAWSGQAFAAADWLSSPSGKIDVTMISTGSAITITMADGSNSYEATLNAAPFWTIPGFLAKGVNLSVYGSNVTVSDMRISSGGGTNTDADWSCGENWTKPAPPAPVGNGVDLIHNGAADAADKATYATKLSGEGFALSFTADFSANTDDHTLYVVLDSGDGQRLETKIINSRVNNVFGPEGIFYDGAWSGQAFAAADWLACPSGKIDITMVSTGSAITITMADGSNSYEVTLNDVPYWTIPGFLAKGVNLSIYGGNVAIDKLLVTEGGGTNNASDWSCGENWTKPAPPAPAGNGVDLTHSGAADAADKAAYATKLSGEGFALSFTADFSANADDQNLFVVLDSGDGQRLETKIISSRVNNVFGPEGIFYDGAWSGQAFAAADWLASPSGKIDVTMVSTGSAITIIMADGINSYEATLDAAPFWTIPGFLAKGVNLSVYGGNVAIDKLLVTEGGGTNNASDWSCGENWTKTDTQPKEDTDCTVDLVHTGTDNLTAAYNPVLSADGFEIDFIVDFSLVPDTQAMYFYLTAKDGRTLWFRMIGETSAQLGGDAYVNGVQVLRIDRWLSNSTRKARFHITVADGSMKLQISTIFNTDLGNTYCDDLGWSNWLPGSNEGRMLMGAANALRWGEDAELSTMVENIIADNLARVRADGYSNYYDESNYTQLSGGDSERKNYDRVFWTRGLLAAGQAGYNDAYTLVRNFYDWFNTSPYLPQMVVGSNATNGFPGGPLVALSEVGTAQDLLTSQKYFDLNFWMEDLTQENPMSMGYFPGDRPHTYLLLILESMLDEYRVTGDARYLNAVLGGWNVYSDNYLHEGGSTAICEETIGAFPPKSYYLSSHTGETCGSVFWTNVNSKLLQLYPTQEKYAAAIEESLFNVLFSAQDERGYISYHNNLQGGKDNHGCSNVCCEVSSTDLYARLPELVYSIADNGIYVNQFISADIQTDTLKLSMTTGFPNNGETSITVSCAEPKTTSLWIRVPSWANEDVTLLVNGEAVATGTPGSYVELNRQWNNGDTVSFTLPMKLHFETYTGLEQVEGCTRQALLYGPILLAYTGTLRGINGVPAIGATAEELLNGGLTRTGEELEWTVNGAEGRSFKAYWQITDGTFTAFPIIGKNVELVPSPADYGWRTDEVEGVEDFSGWTAADGQNVTGVYSESVGGHRMWKDFLVDRNSFTAVVTADTDNTGSAYVKIFGQIIELDGRNGSGEQVFVKAGGDRGWLNAQGAAVTVYITRINGGDLLIDLQGVGQEAVTSFTLPVAEDNSNLEIGLYAGTTAFRDITVTAPNRPVIPEPKKNPGDFGWDTDEIGGAKDFSGWTATDAANIAVDYAATTGNHRIWKGLLANQDDFTATLEVTANNATSVYVKVLGITLELDGNGGDGNQVFVKLNGTNKDWLTCSGCVTNVEITRTKGGDLSFTLTGKGNATPMVLTAAASESNENLELGLYRGSAEYENIAVVCKEICEHNWVLDTEASVAATCTEAGSNVYVCSKCEETKEETVQAMGHTEVIDEAVTATCTATGLTEGSHCSVCNEILVAQTETEKLPHTEVIDKAVAATCTATGLTEGSHCSVCNEILVAQTETEKLPHTEVIDEAVAATCTATGLTEGSHCSVCNEILVAQTETEKLPHTEVIDEAIAATCTATGLTEGSHCSVCNEVLVAQTETEKLPHTEVIDEAVAATCTENGLTEGKHCSVCDEVLITQNEIVAIGHDWDEGVVTTAPTATEKGVMTFTCSRCDATRTEEIPETGEIILPFTDIPEGKWFTEAVKFAYAKELFSGTSATEFSPNDNMTRGMLVTVLWRLDGKPTPEGENTFSDVEAGKYYTDAVIWAAKNEIVLGIGNGKFDPDGNVTREQIAVIMYRYAAFKGCNTEKTADLTSFPDYTQVSSWAKTALAWANAGGLINGADGKLLPTGNATRAQVATILMRYVENIVE